MWYVSRNLNEVNQIDTQEKGTTGREGRTWKSPEAEHDVCSKNSRVNRVGLWCVGEKWKEEKSEISQDPDTEGSVGYWSKFALYAKYDEKASPTPHAQHVMEIEESKITEKFWAWVSG